MIEFRSGLHELLDRVSALPGVAAIGIAGGEPAAVPDGSDVDVFVYADAVPLSSLRQASYREERGPFECVEIDAIEGGPWGIADHLVLDGTDIWLMYFTKAETIDDMEATLAGGRPDREDGFFPIGRLATLKNLFVVTDAKGFLRQVKDRLAMYPDSLRKAMIERHLPLSEDEEDLASAVRHRDVLFFHAVLDEALEHFLQTLYALNGNYYPSRKRNLNPLADFNVKPQRCAERILHVVACASDPLRLAEAASAWHGLVTELEGLVRISSI